MSALGLRLPSRARARGYNMIEVMMGLAILTVGASGVMALEKITIAGVTEGRNITAASTIAAQHLEVVKADGANFNLGTADLISTETPILTALTAFALSDPGKWLTPDTGAVGVPLGSSDVTGRTSDDAGFPVGAAVAYCTQLRADIIESDAAGPVLIRVSARTFWSKAGRSVRSECSSTTSGDDVDAALSSGTFNVGGLSYPTNTYGWVFLTTSLRRNTLP